MNRMGFVGFAKYKKNIFKSILKRADKIIFFDKNKAKLNIFYY